MAGRAERISMTDAWVRALWNKRKRHPWLSNPRSETNPKGSRKEQFFYDAIVPGLDILWLPTGQLSWGMKKRWAGRGTNPAWRSIATVYVRPKDDEKPKDGEKPLIAGALSLSEARERARSWLDMLSRGIDPVAEAKRVRGENRRRITFAELRDEHIRLHWKRQKLAKAGEAERLLKREFAAWEKRPAVDITKADVDEAIQVIVARDALYQAHNAFGYLRGLYAWALDNPRYHIRESPCTGLRPVNMIGAKESRTRWLSDTELREVWNAAGKLELAGQVICLLCLTPQRVNEIAAMPWSEVDLDKGQIVVRANRTGVKNKVDHLIPICPEMRRILESIPRGSRGNYVFSTTEGLKPMVIGSKIKDKLDALLNWPVRLNEDGEDENAWIWHDLRRTVRTNLTPIGVAEPVAEAMMCHVKKGLIRTYDLYKYEKEKRDALMRWETRLMSIVNPATPEVADVAAAREQCAAS